MSPVGRLAAIALILGARSVAAQVRVVNMIPILFGDETQWNPEPTLAVHPTDRGLLAASAFLLGTDVCENSSVSPILVSRDTGATWQMVCSLPTPGLAGMPAADVSLRWGSSGRLYAAYVWPPTSDSVPLRVAVTDDVFAPRPMTTILSKNLVDQPDLLVFNHAGHDRVMVAGSYKDAMPKTAGILWADDPQAGAVFQRVSLERRNISGQNYAVRLAVHEASARVYALYNAGPRRLRNAKGQFLDITVSRDDSAGASAVPFTALLETQRTRQPDNCPTGDSLPGVRLARCRPYPNDSIQIFGYQRRVEVELSVATDPTDATGNRVYVAWCDSLAGPAHLQAQLAASADGGQTWRQILAVPNATNPSVAVDSTGRVGFLFQQLATVSSKARWMTRLLISSDQMIHARSYTLADTPALESLVREQPYIGDWIELHARGKEFLGVFSAANRPDSANFPNGVTYQRVALYQKKILVRRTPLLGASQDLEVAPSIDPYFFRVGPDEAAECGSLRLRAQPAPASPASVAPAPSAIANATMRRMMQIGCDR